MSKSKAAPPPAPPPLDQAALSAQLAQCLRLLGQPVPLAPPLMLQEALANWNPALLPR